MTAVPCTIPFPVIPAEAGIQQDLNPDSQDSRMSMMKNQENP